MSAHRGNWKTASVGELAESIQYGYTASSSTTEVGPRFLRITDIQDQNVDWSTVPFCKIPENQIAKYLLNKGDLLFARTGATVGKSFLIQSEVPKSVFASYLIRVRVTDAIDPRYIYFFFQSADYWRQISESASGIGQPNVNGKKLAALKLPIPPLPEQRRIVARIEELFSRLDAGVAALRHAKAQLQRYRQSVLAAAVTGQLTQSWREQHPESQTTPESHLALIAERRALDFEKRLEAWGRKVNSGIKQPKPKPPLTVENQRGADMPKGWVRLKIASVCDIEDGDRGKAYPKKADFSPSGFCLFLNTGNVRPDGFRFDENQFVTQAKHLELRKGTLERGDIVFTSRGTIGNIAHYDDSVPYETIRINSGMFILRGFQAAMTPEFLACLLRSPQIRDQIAELQSGSAQPQLPIREFREFRGEIPPIAEQHRIVAEVEARTTAIDHLEAELDRQIIRSSRLRQSTLQSAFAGHL